MTIKGILGSISFLTIIPIGNRHSNNDLNNIAKNMYFFPIIGLLIGLVIIPIAILGSFYLENHYISALIIVVFLSIITGLHHIDALADFADGIMVKGDREKKYQVIHAPNIGAAGVFAIFVYLLGIVIIISSYNNVEKLIIALLLSEIVSKYSMVLQAYHFNSAWNGYSSSFTKHMKSKKKIILSTVITITLINIVSFFNSIWIPPFFTSIICSFIIGYISQKNFGGISGDVMGTTNEITQFCSLFVLSI